MIKLQSEEKLIRVIRKHWIIIAVEILFTLVLILLPLFLAGVIVATALTWPLGELIPHVNQVLLFIYLIYLLAVWSSLVLGWTDYYLDVWYLTDQRLIDIEQNGMFNRNEAALELSRIQDVTIDVRGLIPTLLRYGTIRVQTAGERREFLMRYATDPERVKEEILSLAKAFNDKPQAVYLT